jgi:hypothetical protein
VGGTQIFSLMIIRSEERFIPDSILNFCLRADVVSYPWWSTFGLDLFISLSRNEIKTNNKFPLKQQTKNIVLNGIDFPRLCSTFEEIIK